MMPSLGKGSRSPLVFSIRVKSWPLNRVMREDPQRISSPKPPGKITTFSTGIRVSTQISRYSLTGGPWGRRSPSDTPDDLKWCHTCHLAPARAPAAPPWTGLGSVWGVKVKVVPKGRIAPRREGVLRAGLDVSRALLSNRLLVGQMAAKGSPAHAGAKCIVLRQKNRHAPVSPAMRLRARALMAQTGTEFGYVFISPYTKLTTFVQADDKTISYLQFLDPYETDVQENVYGNTHRIGMRQKHSVPERARASLGALLTVRLHAHNVAELRTHVARASLLSVAGFLLQLANTEEYIDGALSGHLGEVLIRCNNVLYIRGVEEEEEDGEMRE
nr:PREDICTED: small nuclear ribonucleoprotein F [Opisthocomus hoazin]